MKDKTTAGVLAIVLNALGIHKFYMGDNKNGAIWLVLCLFTAGLFGIMGILGILEGIKILMGTEEEFQARMEAKKFFQF